MEVDEEIARFDAIVVGAGFGGLCALHRLRALGLRTVVFEKGDGVGGTWYWNRYPGARVDVHGVEYSFSFSPEVEQEWNWSEVMPTQPEIERYLNFVADRLDLRRDIRFATTVVAARFDDGASEWTVTTDDGRSFVTRFLVSATGCLSAPLTPDIAGIDTFGGVTLYTSDFPREGFDFRGHRVGVVGTGSSGVQVIPVVAEQAEHLHVFQRSAAFTRPANNRAIDAAEMARIKADYGELRQRLANSFSGTLHVGAVTVEAVPDDQHILRASPEQRQQKIDEVGWSAPWSWADVLVDVDANRAGVELYGELIRRAVRDPRHRGVADAALPAGVQAPDLRHRLLRHVQSRQRDARRPAQGTDRGGQRDRHPDSRSTNRSRCHRLRHWFRRDHRCAQSHRHRRPRRPIVAIGMGRRPAHHARAAVGGLPPTCS